MNGLSSNSHLLHLLTMPQLKGGRNPLVFAFFSGIFWGMGFLLPREQLSF
jgi:hypothetical protein